MGWMDWIRERSATNGTRPGNGVKPEEAHMSPNAFSSNRLGFTSLELTDRGNRITGLSQTEWRSNDGGASEFRQHVGLSKEGYHGGLEVSHGGGESSFTWSKGCPDERGAEKASHSMRHEFEGNECLNQKTKPRPRPSWER